MVVKLHNISFNNLKRRKGKVLFLVLGLLIGISTIVTLLSITESMTRDIEDRLDQFGANIVMVPRSDNLSLSYGGISVGGVSYEMKEFQEADLPRIRQIEDNKNLGAVAPKVLGVADIKGRKVLLMGVDFGVELNLKTWWMINGKAPSNDAELIAGHEVATALGLKTGDTVVLRGRTFTVAALLQQTGGPEDNLLIGDLHAMQTVLGKQDKISLVEIAAFCRDCPINEMVLQIADQFPDSKVTALKQAVMSKMQSIDMFKSFSYGIAALVIFIGSLLVFVTMMGSVNERTREIGIFRAIGFRRGHVMQIILLEAIVVGFLGGLFGYLFGNGIAWTVIPLIMKDSSFAGLNPNLGVVSVLLAIALSLLASLYPAHKGSQLDPSEALRAL
jgi:putative ABC transport system permease protein